MWLAEALRGSMAGALLLAAGLPGSAWAQDAPTRAPDQLAPLVTPDGMIDPAWRFVGFPKKHTDLPPTRFEAGSMDGVPGVQVITDASYGTLVHRWAGAPPSHLQWRWRLDTPLSGGRKPDLLTKAGDDAALKVCVMFEQPLERIPFLERTVLRLARGISGETLPAATLCYVWAGNQARTFEGVNPYTRRVRFVVLQGRSAPLTRWVSESRDVAQDFLRLFADELPPELAPVHANVPPVSAVVIGADADNTASHSNAWVADLRWDTP